MPEAFSRRLFFSLRKLSFRPSDVALHYFRFLGITRRMGASPVRYGVPQGSVLGPILFNLYTSPIHSISKKHGVLDHYYADDDQKYLSFSLKGGDLDQHSAFSLISSCIEETKSWMADNFLQLNDSKTDAIVVYSKSSRRKPSAIPLNIGSVQVFPSNTVCNLGVILDENLTMRQHIAKTCCTAYFHLRRIAKIRKFLSRSACSQLVSAFILSHIDYGNSLLAGLPSERLRPLKRLQYCLNGCAPSYLTDLVSLRNSSRGPRVLRSSTAPSALYDLVPPSIRLKKDGMRAFSSYAPTIWNDLPISVRSSPSLSRFRSALKKHYFTDAFLTQSPRYS